jgi:hypothetical protein
MVNAFGLKPVLAIVPGHCFPIVFLPSGKYAGVEVTGIGSGRRKHESFDKVVEIGNAEATKYVVQSDDDQLVDVQHCWSVGVANPELESLPADILQRREIHDGTTSRGGESGRNAEERRTRQEVPADNNTTTTATPADPFSGTWYGTMTINGNDGMGITVPFGIVIQSDGRGNYQATSRFLIILPMDDGRTIQAQVDETYAGRINEGYLAMKGQTKSDTVFATGQSVAMNDYDVLIFQYQNGRLIGLIGQDQNAMSQPQLEKQQ